MTMTYKRILNFESTLKRKSLFLFGPRQTGKSTFLKKQYPEALLIDLLNYTQYESLLKTPEILRDKVHYFIKNESVEIRHLIIIDEIQKLPELLNIVHSLIEEFDTLRFVLTGSSARKLKRGGANLLGGRASWAQLYPLTYPEMESMEKWILSLTRGAIPSIMDSEDYFADLNDYTGLYLVEEIKEEGLARSIQNFAKFLEFAAMINTEQVNFTQLGSDLQVHPTTVKEYFQILSDTLVGYLLPAFTKTLKRKAMSKAKFYLFDCGVANALTRRRCIAPGTIEFGKVFEQAIFIEINSFINYHFLGRDLEIFYWRSTSKFEVDFIIQNFQKKIIAIEVKGKQNIQKKDLKGLIAFSEENLDIQKKIIVYCGKDTRLTEEGIELLPIQIFLEKLWSKNLFEPLSRSR